MPSTVWPLNSSPSRSNALGSSSVHLRDHVLGLGQPGGQAGLDLGRTTTTRTGQASVGAVSGSGTTNR